MSGKRVAPYGSWPSPLGAADLAGAKVRLGELRVVDGAVYWLESRPDEGGRSVVVRRDADGGRRDLVPPGMGARTTVHEYGGGAYAVAGDVLYFCNFADQGIYASRDGQAARPIVVRDGLRFADLVVDSRRSRLICVQEDHRGSGEATSSLVSIALDGGAIETLAAGHDFYASARLSPGGGRLAWLSWRHPRMPWDGTDLWVAELSADGRPGEPRHLAGGTEESIFQPRWSDGGDLWYASDRSGYWNLYRHDGETEHAVTGLEADIGMPQWVFGLSVYDCDEEGAVFAACERGAWRLYRTAEQGGVEGPFDSPYQEIRDVQRDGDRVVFVGGAPDRPTAVASVDRHGGDLRLLFETGSIDVQPETLSRPAVIEVPTSGGERTFALYYPPTSADYEGPEGEAPPLIVLSHGGPTSSASCALNLEVQFWTSRGFAVADVNYRGSTGFGRAYRRALDGRWGVADVDDCCAVALHLVERGAADRGRLIIRGGSAGGYTTLAALAFRDVFAAGASYYGIGDLEALASDTHKFEARYLDRMIGPYPDRRDLYRERSPLYAADRLSCPVIFFQGLEDKVVPPNQAEAMVAALRKKGVPVAYVPFAGEQHGFRRAENIRRALECELYFYSRVLGFEVAGDPPDLSIDPAPL